MKPPKRQHCPFYGYGFSRVLDVYIDSGGNQCAMARDHTPCAMELKGGKPDWDRCPVNPVNLGDLAFVPTGRIYPSEYPSTGVSFDAWFYAHSGYEMRPYLITFAILGLFIGLVACYVAFTESPGDMPADSGYTLPG